MPSLDGLSSPILDIDCSDPLLLFDSLGLMGLIAPDSYRYPDNGSDIRIHCVWYPDITCQGQGRAMLIALASPAFSPFRPALRPAMARLPRARWPSMVELDARGYRAEGHDLAFEAAVDSLPVAPHWQQRVREFTKPAAIALVPVLSTANDLCYENKHGVKDGTLVAFALQEKRKHPEKVLLIRVGEFYESFGLDALLLVQHAGLNPMGRKCRAGCPVQNIQPTLDDLTAAGLTVAVYEEVAPAGGPGRFSKLKQRALVQVVSAGSPTYMYEACLSPDPIPYTEPPPVVAVQGSASGYTVVQVRARGWGRSTLRSRGRR